MLLNRKKIAEMTESSLRKEVLIPLFEAMGYQDVHETHGSHELGKDIVMWQRDLAKERVNYAVVAKASRITGSTRSVSDVCTQVRQCFGRGYVDPVSLKDQMVDFVIVINSGAVTNEAREAIKADLEGSGVFDKVDIIDGKTLLRRIRQYMPKALVWDALDQARQALSNLDNGLKYTLQIESDGPTNVLVSPKDDPAMSINGSMTLRFPETVEGIAKRAEYDHHLKTGQPIEFTQEFIESFKMSDILDPLHNEGEVTNLYMGATRVHPPLLMRLEAEGVNGFGLTLDYVDFTHRHGGSEEITYKNSAQPTPLKFDLTIKKGTDQATLKWHTEPEEHNAFQHLKLIHIAKILCDGGEIRMSDWNTGLPIYRLSLKPGLLPEPSDFEIDSYEKILSIQRKIGVVFTVGHDTKEDLGDVDAVYNATHYGRFKSEEASFRVESIPLQLSDWTWKDRIGQNVALSVKVKNLEMSILGQKISLGQAHILYQGTIAEEKRLDLDGLEVEGSNIVLNSSKEHPFLCVFPKWLRQAEEPETNRGPQDGTSQPRES